MEIHLQMKMALFLLLIPSLVDGQTLQKLSQLPYTNRVALEDEVVLLSKDPTATTGYRDRRTAFSNIIFPIFSINVDSNDIVTAPWGKISSVGTKTGGIQEAINASIYANPSGTGPGGIPIILGPGIHKTYTNIYTPNVRTANSFHLYGPGQFSGGITYMGTSNMDVLTIGFPGGFDENEVDIRHLWIASNFNSTNKLLRLNSYETNNDYATFGSIGHGNISDCEFMYWGAYGGVSGGTIKFGVLLTDTNKHNLIPIDIDCNFNNNVSVYRCHFVSVNGVSWASDHGVYMDNSHVNNGKRNTIPNDWPTNSIYSAGACVYITKGGSGLGNGNEPWVFSKNSYQTTDLAYIVNDNTFPRSIISYDDNFEDVPTAVATTGRKFILINPTYTSGDAFGFTNNFVITNITDFTKWNLNPDTNSTVSVVDFRSGNLYNVGLTMDNNIIRKGTIIHSNTLASIPTLVPGDVYNYSSNGIAFRILVGPTGTRTTNTW